MSVALWGSQSVERILLFLFVNGKCYPTELKRAFQTALTPIQKAFQRLEDGGVVISYYEGKTKVYSFNPSFPLLGQLKELLKGAYALIPSEEKRKLFSFPEERSWTAKERIEAVKRFSHILDKISHLHSHSEAGAVGQADVVVSRDEEGRVLFREKGYWLENGVRRTASFYNVLRWTVDPYRGEIALDHLRRGENHPIFLFHFLPHSPLVFVSKNPHHCTEDDYFAIIRLEERRSSFTMHWRILGPTKNEVMAYHYF